MLSAMRLLQCCALLLTAYAADLPAPQIASPAVVPNNPTRTTVALQKPVCTFDGAIATLGGAASAYKVSLYGVSATASNMAITSQTASFSSTAGGTTGPYQVGLFDVPTCSLVGSLDPTQPSSLSQYVFRVGDNITCLNDPNFSGICNPPLNASAAYRFRYGLISVATNSIVNQTLWSDPITTKTVKTVDTIDTWPGRRSGGMIVITSILSTLLFFLLAGFVAAVVANVMSGGSSSVTERHETQTTQSALPKPQTTADPNFSAVIAGANVDRERYAAKPQV